MKKIALIIIVLLLSIPLHAELQGEWLIQGEIPAKSVEFRAADCIFTMRDGQQFIYPYSQNNQFVFINHLGYYYSETKKDLILLPAFGEDERVLYLLRKSI